MFPQVVPGEYREFAHQAEIGVERGIDGSQARDRGGDGLRRVRRNVAARVDQHELAHTLRRDGGEIHADDGSERMADDVDRVEVERVAERQHVGGMEGNIVAVRWFGAEAASTQIQRDGVPSLQRRALAPLPNSIWLAVSPWMSTTARSGVVGWPQVW